MASPAVGGDAAEHRSDASSAHGHGLLDQLRHSGHSPWILGHRGMGKLGKGSSQEWPENTLRSFSAALDAGALAVECDVHRTCDGAVIVLHDATLRRTAEVRDEGISGEQSEQSSAVHILDTPVTKLSLEQVRCVHVGNGKPVPLLHEVLELVMQKCGGLFIELKSDGCEDEIARLLQARPSAVNHVNVISFDVNRLKRARETLPVQTDVGLLCHALPIGWEAEASRLNFTNIGVRHTVVHATEVGNVHSAGLALWVWNPAGAAEVERAVGLGVAGMGSDDPPNSFQLVRSLSPAMIVVGSDHAGFDMKRKLVEHLKVSHNILDVGCQSAERCDYPSFAKEVAKQVLGASDRRGILVCGSGIGISMAANKIDGIRCVLCHDTDGAFIGRREHDANVVALGGRATELDTARAIVDTFLRSAFDARMHLDSMRKFTTLESARRRIVASVDENETLAPVVVASNQAGHDLKKKVVLHLQNSMGLPVEDLNVHSEQGSDWTQASEITGAAVLRDSRRRGIVVCDSVLGASIAANKISGIRCALCHDRHSAQMTRQHNDANMLALGSSKTTLELAIDIVEAFLTSSFDGGVHKKRVDIMSELEQSGIC